MQALVARLVASTKCGKLQLKHQTHDIVQHDKHRLSSNRSKPQYLRSHLTMQKEYDMTGVQRVRVECQHSCMHAGCDSQ